MLFFLVGVGLFPRELSKLIVKAMSKIFGGGFGVQCSRRRS